MRPPDLVSEEQKAIDDRQGGARVADNMDRTYVSQFLKEIDEIENINHRADKFIEDKTFETYMRRSPDPAIEQAVPQQRRREENKTPAPGRRPPTIAENEGELNNSSFFITASPDTSTIIAEGTAPGSQAPF